ncbi:hypothetical protein BS78_04G144100 [Paspalum vaginatum]|nr:hypothetical protein BS78_04G144100 [Paspalum vaginatum]
MTVHLRAMGGKLWRIVKDGYIILKKDAFIPTSEENILVNDQAMNVLYDALYVSEFNRIKNLKTAWTKLMEIHEGTTMVKSAKLYAYKGKFDQFAMKKDESVSEMFNRLNEVVNELKALGFNVLDKDFSHNSYLDDESEASKLIVDIAIKEATSLFSTPHCLMERGSLMVNDDDDDDDNDDDDLLKMLSEADNNMYKKNEKFKELKTSPENLKEAHEKVEEAHNFNLVHEATMVKVDMSVTCDLLDSSTNARNPTNSSCSTCNGSYMKDDFSCDATLIVENEVQRKEVEHLTRDLKRAYGGMIKLNLTLGSQRCSHNHEGLGYVSRKGKDVFTPQKTTFTKEYGKTCHK